MKYILMLLVVAQASFAFAQAKPKNCDCQTGYGTARGDCRFFCMGGNGYTSEKSENVDRAPASSYEEED
ncbi:MAG: hypothetical protein H7328_05560 [Bdellovibrio sp.]|nr:hypothetical protein [Bdellovibrio sp.]